VDRYVIRGGHEGYERLKLLARERWPSTRALLERAGLGPGMRCIDLGCGGGEVTLQIARMIAPDGEIVGIDMDEIKLARARDAAADRGVTNVEFRALNVREWSEPGSYDAVFCRFVLQHLSNPVDVLARMWDAVRPEGALIVEDADFDGWCCHPPNEGFAFFLRAYGQAVAHWGGDHVLGRRLYYYFLEIGIPHPNVSVVQPIYIEGEGKTLPLSTLAASRDAIIDAGVASEAELNAALEQLAGLTNDPRSLISGPRIFQVWSRR
jgi:ubiquinone/menaquinone biosynthesis C-methylase UbiE